jgi:aldose 1-epimerase
MQLPPHAIHGVTVDRPWQVLDAGPATAALACAFDSRWPWPGGARCEIRLEPDGLEARLEVHADREPMPAWCGWHPWFSRRLGRGADVRVDLTAGAMFATDAEAMPTGALVPRPTGTVDDCFDDVRWPVGLLWEGALRLSVSADCRYAVVFDRKPGAVCVEPQTAPPDAVALGREAVVEPGSPLTLTMRWTWEPA